MALDPLAVPVTLDSLTRVREYVEEAAVEAGLDEERAYRLTLAVDEVITNTITHGYPAQAPADSEAVIIVSAATTPRELVITVDDEAPPFDPHTVPDPSQEELQSAPEERKVGGLGLYLARTNVDRFDYEWKEGHNRTILTVQRTGGKEKTS
jgi:anti-sigma regulatory factor (Ser/Thr protein kinase)